MHFLPFLGISALSILTARAQSVPTVDCPVDIIANAPTEPNGYLFADPTDCTKFLQCTISPDEPPVARAYIMSCPETLMWNDKHKQCDWADQSTCPDVNA